MSEPTIPPTTMLRSFLTVGSGYISQLMIWQFLTVLIGVMFFPEFVKFSELSEEAQMQIMEVDPWSVFSPLMFWSVVIATTLASVGIGWFVFKTAPFAQFPHAVFVAILLFINYLQLLIGDPPAKKTMTIVFMTAFPIAVLVGARIARGRPVPEDEAELEVEEQDSTQTQV